MPYLVDSIAAEFARRGRGVQVQRIVHPYRRGQPRPDRRAAGSAPRRGPRGSSRPGEPARRVVDVHRDRLRHRPDDRAREARQPARPAGAGRRPRGRSRTPRRCQPRRPASSSSELETDPPRLPEGRGGPVEGAPGAGAGWPTATSRSSATASTTSSTTTWTATTSAACPGTGYGGLRATTPTCSTPSGKLPTKVAEMARQPTLLVLAKANSRSTVHRPAYLDYVGVKTFDAAGEVVGERRLPLGLFSSAAYTESVWRIPLLREEGQGRAPPDRPRPPQPRRQGPDRHARDLPTRRAVPYAGRRARPRWGTRVMETRGRRQLRIFARRDTYGRYVSVLVFLPRDRYNTTVRERFSGDPQGELPRRVRRVHGAG